MRRTLLISALLAAAGCGSLLPHPAARGRSETGFLSSYGALQAASDRPGVFVWRRADVDFGPYDTVVVEPPVLRRKPGDVLPSPEERESMCAELRARVRDALKADYRVVDSIEQADRSKDDVLRVRVAVTTALVDRGTERPEGEWQMWGDQPGEFSLECEVVDGFNGRPVAKMVAFDRTRQLPAGVITPWKDCETLFVRWGADVAWLVQPPPEVPPAAPAVVEPAAPPAEPSPATPAAGEDPAPVST